MIRLISLSMALCLAALVFANERGTVVGPEYCGNPNASAERRGRADTLYTRVSDGQGGTWRRTVEVGAAQCAPHAPAPRGTVVGPEYCGAGLGPRDLYTTLYTRVSNGSGGTWRRTVEEDSASCPSVLVTTVAEEGDRFVPVTFDIFAPDGYEYEATLGNVSRTDTGLEILGDGRTGTGQITIAGWEYQYTINDEPRCAKTSTFTDCMGYGYRGKAAGYIYYGEEDTRVVEWEISIVFYSGEDERLIEKGDRLYTLAEEKVEYMNTVYARSDVYIKYKLVAVGVGNFADGRGVWTANNGPVWAVLNDADIQLGSGESCPGTCGCAEVQTYFSEDTIYPIGSASICGGIVDVHEIGHSVGLAHGPDNRGYPAEGYIWPDFGHGHSTTFCGRWADIMSYEPSSIVANNSRQTCADYAEDPYLYRNVTEDEYDNPTGNRGYADSAYHLNRVRYDVSLTHCADDNQCRPRTRVVQSAVEDEERILVQDIIEDFDLGAKRAEYELRTLKRMMSP